MYLGFFNVNYANCANITNLLLNGPAPASFSFSTSFQTLLQKNCGIQRDSNSDRQSNRQAR